jgi:hypothetical protein
MANGKNIQNPIIAFQNCQPTQKGASFDEYKTQ